MEGVVFTEEVAEEGAFMEEAVVEGTAAKPH
jgi:hypothetical protein